MEAISVGGQIYCRVTVSSCNGPRTSRIENIFYIFHRETASRRASVASFHAFPLGVTVFVRPYFASRSRNSSVIFHRLCILFTIVLTRELNSRSLGVDLFWIKPSVREISMLGIGRKG